MGNLTLFNALTIDIFAVAICLAIAAREARSPLHPAWMFLGLHAYIVTFRLFQLYTGSHPMKATFAWPVAVNEVLRAGAASDLGLLAMALGWIAARWIFKRQPPGRPEALAVSKIRVYIAAAVALGLGTVGALTVGRLEHTMKNTSWDTSGYFAATTSWPAWSVCLLHFIYGFPIPLLAVTAVVLVFVGLTNISRFAVVIPVIFLTLTWLSRRRTRRFPLTLVAGILVAWAIWLPMKPFTRMLRDGARVTDALNEAIRYTYTEIDKDEGSVDQQFLDMSAATMTLSDLRGTWFWGATIAPLFVSPVPRVLWPEKPKTNQYQWDLQVPARNMAELGMTAGLVAEGYVNFGYAGVALYCFGAGFAFAWAYLKVVHSYYLSPSRLLYFFCLASASQVYRDGLISAVWFPFVYAAPIGWTAVSHWIWKPGRRSAPQPARPTMGEAVEYVR
ncbi:MAG: hypothetical protein ABSG65_06860 [Bryobacteraceae bacterium]|jgi:hypothetical protein